MKFYFLFALFSISASACEVILPSNLLVIGPEFTSRNPYQSNNCDAAVLKEVHEILLDVDGRIASFQMEEMLKSKGHNTIVSPSSIQVQQLKTIIREQLTLPSGTQVYETRSSTTAPIMALSTGDRIEVSCLNCLFGMQQPLNFTVNSFDGTKHSHFANADFKKMVRAYRLISATPSFSDLNHSLSLTEAYVEAIPHTDLVTEVDNLRFYKTNKPLKAGDLLRRSDLNALNLVKAGLRTEVILENSLVRIKTQGISRGNGAIGETVEVFHQEKNKKYQGKVVDINKVLVEL